MPLFNYPLGLGVIKNKAIEEWAHFRENTHKTFKFTKRTSLYGIVFCIAVPAVVHSFVKEEELKKTAVGVTNHSKSQDYL
ncbi:uncharacterized protein AMSG_03519 [Thecamonas trahens ATCC 50062]|uniref:NADH dehydrogenase [ubiquinone] 1 beta subcomplex subunit 4 n=1 Tax=Thecamonas trahens ATCC 50062 TaxID=461836 RepID=A0A0L0D737_THETB|nr:hypothetical protein AMSG_03519 [Thecamonas trahens ATCC 50062]KNC47093.1 hypothetical protein AMSG_03519 [Thecamonas trahens ATCC 50062]|eukprot:XP_013759871.1 hypothetical protein AMSG_03519 [Thecamonas trahens ATCC 50062]